MASPAPDCSTFIRGWLESGKKDSREKAGRKRRVYISGQITGLEESEYRRLFSEAERSLSRLGYEPVNPCALDEAEDTGGWTWSDYMRRDIKMLCGCDLICLLPNWRKSRGARLERTVAEMLGIERIGKPEFRQEAENEIQDI